jgi:hypothetical protein
MLVRWRRRREFAPRHEALPFLIPKPAVALAGFVARLGWRGPQSDALSVPRERLLVNGRADQQLVMRRRTIRVARGMTGDGTLPLGYPGPLGPSHYFR